MPVSCRELRAAQEPATVGGQPNGRAAPSPCRAAPLERLASPRRRGRKTSPARTHERRRRRPRAVRQSEHQRTAEEGDADEPLPTPRPRRAAVPLAAIGPATENSLLGHAEPILSLTYGGRGWVPFTGPPGARPVARRLHHAQDDRRDRRRPGVLGDRLLGRIGRRAPRAVGAVVHGHWGQTRG